MHSLLMALFSAMLFFILTPGVLLTLPKGGSKMTVALVHAAVFAMIWHFSHHFVYKMLVNNDMMMSKMGTVSNL